MPSMGHIKGASLAKWVQILDKLKSLFGDGFRLFLSTSNATQEKSCLKPLRLSVMPSMGHIKV